MEDDQNRDQNSYPPHVRKAFLLFRALMSFERERIVCWFCPICWRYIGPGDHCTCAENEARNTALLDLGDDR